MDTPRGPLGHRRWAISGGHIPLESHGPEPEMTSRDELAILNTTPSDARVEITLYYEDRAPAGPYRVTVGAARTRIIRFNDLIDPQAMPLGVNFAAVIESDVPVVVQFLRLDSSSTRHAWLGTLAFPADE